MNAPTLAPARSPLRRSYKYSGLRTRAIDTGMYTVRRDHDGAAFLIVCDAAQRIGGQRRWVALGTTMPLPRYSATKDDLMRWICAEGDRRAERDPGGRRSA